MPKRKKSAGWTKKHKNETEAKRKKRLDDYKQYNKQYCPNQTPEQRQRRLDASKRCYLNQTPEQRQRRLEAMQHYNQEMVLTETDSKRDTRLEKNRVCKETKRQNDHYHQIATNAQIHAISFAKTHGVSLIPGRKVGADGNCAFNSVIYNINDRPCYTKKLMENATLSYRKNWLTEFQYQAQLHEPELISGLAGDIPEEDIVTLWKELQCDGVWNQDQFGDLIINAISCGCRKVIFVINYGRNEPVSVVTPEEFGVARDSNIPVIVVYDGTHYENLIPATAEDEGRIIDLIPLYSDHTPVIPLPASSSQPATLLQPTATSVASINLQELPPADSTIQPHVAPSINVPNRPSAVCTEDSDTAIPSLHCNSPRVAPSMYVPNRPPAMCTEESDTAIPPLHCNSHIGTLSRVCLHCKALRFPGETANFCCMLGKIYIDPIKDPPPLLRQLFLGNSTHAVEFRKNLRQYNCLFQMTSFGAKEDVRRDSWNPSVIVQGQIHHYIGSIVPDPEDQAKFVQLYFLDPQDSVRLRMGILNNQGIQRQIVETLETELRACNPYIKSLSIAKEQIKNIPNARIVIDPEKRPSDQHERRFNQQSANEVAVIFPSNTDSIPKSRHIVLRERGGPLQVIAESHRSYDALQYVLMFPFGDDGWHRELKTAQNKKMTLMRYYAHRIMIRQDSINLPLRAGRLFQQYVVDMAVKIELDRLTYILLNQEALRSITYKGLTDALNDNDRLENQGQRILLSSSFVGGPRYMMERCQDAMMYIKKYGTASLFITMTCNPNWPEIKENLFEGQQPCDRPDLISRVFELKRKEFIKTVTGHNGIFGKCIAYVSTNEYQKRGLPHLHCLLWLDEESKPRPNYYDTFVQAEIPDPNVDKELHDLVLTHMIHGPHCNDKSPCRKPDRDGCTKRFPKPYCHTTQCGTNAYPVYRRRSPDMGGFYGKKEGSQTIVTSEWVVPYNRILLKKFKCHINTEICCSVKSIKYVIKYTLKGSDQAVFGVGVNDEIKQYVTGRYIGPSEAVASILGFTIHERDPSVYRLQVHLPQQNRVIIRPNADHTLNGDNHTQLGMTTLTSFLDLCNMDPFAKTLLYCDVPRYFTWANKKWQRRKRGKPVEGWPGYFQTTVLGRVYTVSPRCGDLYYLRLLLHHVRGPTSFDAMKTHDGKILTSFKDVCIADGLLQDDDHWLKTMEDAEKTRLPKSIRDLFVCLLVNTDISDVLQLWTRFRDAMSEDYLNTEKRERKDESIIIGERHHDQSLEYIEAKLNVHEKTLTDFDLPIPHRRSTSQTEMNAEIVFSSNPEINRELSYIQEEEADYVNINVCKLTSEQKSIFDHVCNLIDNNVPNQSMVFIDSPGGCGKTFLTNVLLSRIRCTGNIALAVATSGIAATLMAGGRTAHSRFKIPVKIKENSMCAIDKQSHTADLLRKTKLIVWDECPMMRRECFEAVDRTLRDICSNDFPFGGIVTVCLGDFRQLLPVVKRGSEADVENACIKKSYLWRKFSKFYLTKNMRVNEGESAYARLLLKVGEDKLPKNEKHEIDIPHEMILTSSTIEECIDQIYPSFDNPIDLFSKNCILASLNESIRAINSRCIQKFPGIMKEYHAFNTVTEGTNETHFPTEFLDSIEVSGLPPHNLQLKIGSPIMLLRNIDPPRLCNGTRLVVHELQANIIVARISVGQFKDELVFIPRIPIDLTEDDNIPLKRRQFPVQSSFAMTIHKSQGQTLDNVLIFLEKPVFQHGQLYVAMSRGRSRDNVKMFLNGATSTKNIVMRHLL